MTLNITSPIYHELLALGIVDPDEVEQFADHTRDRDIPVYRDRKSKVIFLGEIATSDAYYREQGADDLRKGDVVVSTRGGDEIIPASLEDSERRFRQFETEIRDRTICDFGTGSGHFLTLAHGTATQCFGVELRQECLNRIAAGYPDIDVRPSIEAHARQFDLVTMFHVLEHVPAQTGVLQSVLEALKPGGKVIVEVPHAEDFLIQSVDIPEFRAFTFWSEHLVLHTRASLRTVMQRAGFRNVAIRPYQRYGFTNHLRWFLDRKPGGHDIYRRFENGPLEAVYRLARESDFTCDTLIAIGTR